MSLFPPSAQLSPGRQQTERSVASQDEPRGEDFRRRRSVRFMGPCSVPPRGRRACTDLDSRYSDADSANTTVGGETSSCESHNMALNAPPRPQRAPPPAPLPSMATSYLHALTAQDEYYTPEDDIASAPSSYRRLHRSRSMVSDQFAIRRSHEGPGLSATNKPTKHRLPGVSSSRRFFRSEPNDSKSPNSVPTLRAPKSMSFLGNRKWQSKSSSSREGSTRESRQSGLVDLPEDGSSSMAAQSTTRLRYKPSALFSLRGRRADVKMPKSLRSSGSTEDFGASSTVSETHSEGQGTLRVKARKASRTLKIKLKNLFTHAKPEEETSSIPCQHIEAQRSHATFVPTSDGEDETSTGQRCGIIRNPPVKVPSLRVVSPRLAHSNKASSESLRSERERNVSDGSSLTTWVHSGPSTLTSQEQQQWREWERHRLSVIKENGAHIPSSSLRRQAIGSDLFRVPDNAPGTAVALGPIVDSQRIYSALVKRMQTMNARTEQVEEEGHSGTLASGAVAPVHERSGSSSSSTPETIKRAIPERGYSTASDNITTPTRASRREGFSRGHGTRDEQQTASVDVTPTISGGYQGRPSEDLEHDRLSTSGLGDVASQRQEFRNDLTEDHNDIFFQASTRADQPSRLADSPASYLFRTASPYRRALRKSMQEEQNAWAQQSSASDQVSDAGSQAHHESGLNQPLRETSSDSAKDLDCTESVYSSDGDEHGSVQYARVNRRSRTFAETPANYGRGGWRETSTASSVDWKTWLSANIDKFEPSGSFARPTAVKPALPPVVRGSRSSQFSSLRRHVRENAQTHSNDDCNNYATDVDDDDVFETPTRKPDFGTGPLSQVEPNVVRPRPSSPSWWSSHKRTTIFDTNANSNAPSLTKLTNENESPNRSSPPPPIPPRSKLRPAPLRISRQTPPGSGNGVMSPSGSASVMSSPGLTEAVLRQFGPVSTNTGGYGITEKGGYDRRERVENRRLGIAEVLEQEENETTRWRDKGDESAAFI
ncbi:uncharacterized protein B0T15DRAFT_519549 [Chaetomium strumarium]|uniref:Uncharacterized protein n=1 Tax=Chaetomium strumarium TaxID=1170767 RepID=A0AAJ0M6E9_9PEZI|nr:hypothetical protein B0T15DRAFT_519549 [Chaetomium strumarium]